MKARALGFTLIELLVTVVMIALVLAIAAPSMRDLLLNNRQATDFNKMITSLTLARAEAIKRGANTGVCISDGAAVPDCSAAATRWEDGWIVLVDGNQAGASDGALDDPADTDGDGLWDPGEDWLIQSHEALADGTTLRGNTNVTRSVTFNSRRFPGSAGTLTLCDARGAEEARGIVISNTGRSRRAEDTNGDGIVDVSGVNLTCP